MLDGFTEQAQEAIRRAQREALGMGRTEIQVEDLLLGLFSDKQDVVSGLLADFGLSIESVRDLVRQRVDVGAGDASADEPRFSPSARDALTAAYRFGMGEAGTEHMLIVLVARGESIRDLLRLLGVDPDRLRFEAKLRARRPGAAATGLQLTGTSQLILPELNFGD